MHYQFGEFQLDSTGKKLIKNNTVISDDIKTFMLLQGLCEAYPELADKQQLMSNIWPQQVVSDWSLSRLVSDVRQLLDDDGKEQGFIKTLRGKGFKLNVAVEIIDKVQIGKTAQLSPSKNSTTSDSHVPKIYTRILYSMSVVILMLMVYWGYTADTKSRTNQTAKDSGRMTDTREAPIRIAILPVVSNSNDPIDEWIKYGIMSLANKLLDQYPSIQTIPLSTVITSLESNQSMKDSTNKDSDLFTQLCVPLGCTQVIAITYKLENNQPVLSYQIIDTNKTSQIADFSRGDIIDSADLLLDSLARDLIPSKKIRKSLADTYSDDNKANRDYAIGVNELQIGDYHSSETYLKLALIRQPSFFWAKAYLAEVYYRRGDTERATQQISELTSTSLEGKKSYFLNHLYSNVLYSEGKLAESLAVTKELLNNPVAMADPLLKGNELLNMGSSLQALGKLDESLDYLQRARKSYQLANYGPAEGKVVLNIGNTHLTDNLPKLAIIDYQEAREIFTKYGMQGYALIAKHQIATTNLVLGQYQNAESELRRLIESYKTIGDRRGELTSYLDLAILSDKKANYQESLSRVERLLENLKGDENTYIKNMALAIGTHASLKLKMIDQAEILFNQIDGQWFDPRPSFSLLQAYLLHEKGNYNLALETALLVKEKLGNTWNDAHQVVFDKLQTAKQSQEKQDTIL